MTKVNLNQYPYYDDYDENKKFYRILFRPGRAIQTRELNQLQSLLQKQIERVGAHLFEQGAQVIPGDKEGVKYINNYGFIKIAGTDGNLATTLTQLNQYWLGKTIKSLSEPLDIRAEVVGVLPPDSSGEARLFLNYLRADNSGDNTKFLKNQLITTIDETPISANIVNKDEAIGIAHCVIVAEGVYFFNGNFVFVEQQKLFIQPRDIDDDAAWLEPPTALVGLKVTESVVTADDDDTLYDNAIGTPNFSAPGADRLKISADIFQAPDINFTAGDFVPLLALVNGTLRKRVVNTDYSILEHTLARRTFDESGDYVVNPFIVSVENFLREGNLGGAHPLEEFQCSSKDAAILLANKFFELPIYNEDVEAEGPFAGGVQYEDAWYPTKKDGTFQDFLTLCRDRVSLKIEPGKAYVKGYEIEKIFTTIVDIPRARTLKYQNNSALYTPLGTYLIVTDVEGVPELQNYDLIELHNTPKTQQNNPGGSSSTSRIGTARVLAVELLSTASSTSSATYKLYLFDIKPDANKSLSQLKSVYSGNPTFKCNCSPDYYRLFGSVSIKNQDGITDVTGALNTTSTYMLVGTGTSWKNDQTNVIIANDVVRVGLGVNASYFRVTANPENDNQLLVNYLSGASSILPGSVIEASYVQFQGLQEGSSLVYKLPHDAIKTVRGGSQGAPNPSAKDTVLTVRRVVASDLVTTGTTSVSLTTDELFSPFSINDYIIINKNNGQWMQLQSYDGPAAGAPDGTTIPSNTAVLKIVGNTINIYTKSSESKTLYIIATIQKTNNASLERTKILRSGSFQYFPAQLKHRYSGPYVVVESDANIISLKKADVLRISRVVQSPNFSVEPSDCSDEDLPDGHINVTALYTLDSGQRDYYYDIGRAIRKSGVPKATGKIRVEFDYFDHTLGSTGGYFSVDSYNTEGATAELRYEDIPMFTNSSGETYDLACCLDFRPRVIDDDGLTQIGVSAGFKTYLEPPKGSVRCDYHHYEARADKLYLDKSGAFVVKRGIPEINPKNPDEPATGMTIANLLLRPYTANPSDCAVSMVDNRRYTMRDIGKLEKRIENLEYYTSLSLLEKQTAELVIPDAAGQNKFKNGFMVDNFGSHDAGDYSWDSGARACIDTERQELRPQPQRINVELFEKAELIYENPFDQEQEGRVKKWYQKTGEIYTLPYENVVMLDQPKASKVSNVNPYAVFTYVGVLDISPWSDEWKEADVWAEPHNVVDEGAYDLIKASMGNGKGITTSYGATFNNWTGIDINQVPTGRQKVIIAGHSVVEQRIKEVKERKQEEKSDNANALSAPKQGDKGSKGKSTTNGPGKPAQNAHQRAGRAVVGGHKGGKKKKNK